MIRAIACTASGVAVTQFVIPIGGTIVGASVSASQTTPAFASVSGIQVPASGVSGSGGDLICVFAQNSVFIDTLNFPLKPYQTIQIDVKVAATFTFYIKS